MSTKLFVERLSQCLDEIGLPPHQSERLDAFAKLLDVPRFKAESILNGKMPLDDALLHQLSEELEVSADWLIGKVDVQ